MPRLKGLGMPSKRKHATAKLQEVPEPDADEFDRQCASTHQGGDVGEAAQAAHVFFWP